MNDCNPVGASVAVKINNIGKGKLTFAVPSAISGGSAALVLQASGGLAPATLTFTMDSGRAGVTRQPGTNLYSGAGTSNNGFAVNVSLVSAEAINVPPIIRAFMNFRQTDQRGLIFPTATTGNVTTEGLRDILLDESRGRAYITNSGYNRIEVFDTVNQKLPSPIPVGQLPHQMAMGLDGSSLYVGNTGGESIGIVDLDAGAAVDKVVFPPIPRAGNTSPATPLSLSGLSVVPLAASTAATKPQIAGGAAVVNSTDGTRNYKQGSFITVNGSNLASQATATTLPVPTVLGGSCLVFNDVAAPLLQTSGGQIFAQILDTVRPG